MQNYSSIEFYFYYKPFENIFEKYTQTTNKNILKKEKVFMNKHLGEIGKSFVETLMMMYDGL